MSQGTCLHINKTASDALTLEHLEAVKKELDQNREKDPLQIVVPDWLYDKHELDGNESYVRQSEITLFKPHSWE